MPDTTSAEGDYAHGVYQGQVRPIKRTHTQESPVFDRRHKVQSSNNPRNWSTLRVWAYNPQPEWPDVRIYISIKSAIGSAFTGLSLSEFSDYIAWLNETAESLSEVKPALEALSARCRTLREQIAKLKAIGLSDNTLNPTDLVDRGEQT